MEVISRVGEDYLPQVNEEFIQTPGSAVKSEKPKESDIVNNSKDGNNNIDVEEALTVSLTGVKIQSKDEEEILQPTIKEDDQCDVSEVNQSTVKQESGDGEIESDGEEEEFNENHHSENVPPADLLSRDKRGLIRESIDHTLPIKLSERHPSLIDVKYNPDGSRVPERIDNSSEEIASLEQALEAMKSVGDNPIKAFFMNLKGISEEDVEIQMEGANMDLSIPLSADIFCASIQLCLKDQSHQARIAIFYSVDLLLTALRCHRDSPELVLKLCATIRDLTSMNSILQIKFGKEGCGELFSSLLEQYLNNFDIMILLCEVIRNIVIKDQGKAQFGKEGCCQALVNALFGYVHHPDAAMLICGAVLNISANSMENKRLLGELGCCEPLVEILLLHLNNATVMKIVCGAIQNISVCDDNKKRLGEHGCCEALVHVLLVYLENPTVTWEIFGAIRNVSLNENNMNLFESIGTLELLTKALIMHMSSIDVTRQVCGALRRMVLFPNRTRAKPDLELIRQVWAKKVPLYERYHRIYNEEIICESLVDALAKHSVGNHAEVVKEICAAIKAMALNHEYWARFDLASCAKLLLTVLTYHSNPAQIASHFNPHAIGDTVKEICAAINALARTEETKIKFFEEGACEVFAEVFHRQLSPPPKDELPSIPVSASSDEQEPRDKPTSLQTETTPTSYVNTPNLDILREMARVIKNFALNEECKRSLGELGLCGFLVKTLDLGLGQADTVALICGAILNLSANNPDNKVKFGEAGVCEQLVQVVVIYLANEEVLKQACGAIKNIAVYDENKYLFGEYGACSALIAAITTHLHHRELLIEICEAMWNICVLEENQLLVGDIGGCEIILETLATYFQPSGLNKTPDLAIEAQKEGSESTLVPAVDISSTQQRGALTKTSSKNIIRLLCGILRTISSSPSNHSKIGSAKGCDLLVKILGKYQKQPDLLKLVLQILVMISHSDEVKRQWGDCGGCEKLVLLFLLKKQLDSDVITALCKIFQQLTNNQAENRQRFFTAGGCEIITEVLRRLPKLIHAEIRRRYPVAEISNADAALSSTEASRRPSDASHGAASGASEGKDRSQDLRTLGSISKEEKPDATISRKNDDEEEERVDNNNSFFETPKTAEMCGTEVDQTRKDSDGAEKTEDGEVDDRTSISPGLSEAQKETIASPGISTEPLPMTGPSKLLEMKSQEMKKVFKSLMDKLSKDPQFKKRFDELGTYRYVQETVAVEKKTSTVTKIDFDSNLLPLSTVMEQYQKRQKFSEQRFNNVTILL